MNKQDYEQKKRECWEEFCKANPIHKDSAFARGIFAFIFDRAYALGKKKETATQEEIERAAVEYAASLSECGMYDKETPATKEDIEYAFKAGVKFALGKQEKDTDTVIQGWVARDQDGYISLFKDKPTRDTCDKDDIPYGFFWDEADGNHLELPITSFPDLTWESEPQEVEIILKRKK